MRYLVTGGLGVVGSLLSRQLLDDGHSVEIIDACESPRNEWMAKVILDSYPNAAIWRRRLETMPLANLYDVDAVIHAAAHTGIPHSAEDPNDDWVSNVDATRTLLEALRTCDRKIPTVVMSSVKPYRVHDMLVDRVGERYEWVHPIAGIDETWPLEPDEPYAASKLAQSGLCMAYARTYDLPIVCLRFSNLYGPAPCHGPRHGWLTWLCISKALGIPIEIQGTGFQVRDMLFSPDINAALLAALDHIGDTQGNVYNVGGGRKNSVSVREAVNLLGTDVQITTGEGRKNEDQIFITSHAKFTADTDWTPRVGVEEGIGRIVDWAKENVENLKLVYGMVR